LLIQTPRIIRRIDAERQAFRALEATLENVRAGVIALPPPNQDPDRDPKLTEFFTAAGTWAPKDLEVVIRAEHTHLPGLCHVTLTAHHPALKVDHKLETLVRGPC